MFRNLRSALQKGRMVGELNLVPHHSQCSADGDQLPDATHAPSHRLRRLLESSRTAWLGGSANIGFFLEHDTSRPVQDSRQSQGIEGARGSEAAHLSVLARRSERPPSRVEALAADYLRAADLICVAPPRRIADLKARFYHLGFPFYRIGLLRTP